RARHLSAAALVARSDRGHVRRGPRDECVDIPAARRADDRGPARRRRGARCRRSHRISSRHDSRRHRASRPRAGDDRDARDSRCVGCSLCRPCTRSRYAAALVAAAAVRHAGGGQIVRVLFAVREGVTTVRIALFNDTGTQPHVGCLAVSAAHRLLLDRAGIRIARTYDGSQWHELTRPSLAAATEAALASHALRAVFTDVDAVVVNGEGTIHHAGGQHLLAILAAAAWVGRPALLVNAVLQDIDEARPVLAVLDDCTVRDARSARYLRRLSVPHRLVPDSIFNAPFLAEPCHDFSGALVVTDCHPARTAEFAP